MISFLDMLFLMVQLVVTISRPAVALAFSYHDLLVFNFVGSAQEES